jgi:hypothetical protein
LAYDDLVMTALLRIPGAVTMSETSKGFGVRVQDDLLRLSAEGLIRKLREFLGDVENDDVRDELAAVCEEVFERWNPAALKRETWRELIEEDYPEPELDDLRAREMSLLVAGWEERAVLRPLEQELGRDDDELSN